MGWHFVNPRTTAALPGSVFVDSTLSAPGTVMQVRYGSQDGELDQVTVTSTAAGIRNEEVDGSVSTGPAYVIELTVHPMEALVLTRQTG